MLPQTIMLSWKVLFLWTRIYITYNIHTYICQIYAPGLAPWSHFNRLDLSFYLSFGFCVQQNEFFLHNCHTMTKYFVVNQNKYRKPNWKCQKSAQKLQRQCHLWPTVCLLRAYYAYYPYYAVTAEVFCANFINIFIFFTNFVPLRHAFTTFATVSNAVFAIRLLAYIHTYICNVCIIAICFVVCNHVWLYCLVILLTNVRLPKQKS